MAETNGIACTTQSLQAEIERLFPSHPYYGRVMEQSYPAADWESPLDDLDTYLYGKSWKELVPTYRFISDSEFILMNSGAIQALFAAWLWTAAEDPEGSNDLRDFLAGCFSPSHPSGRETELDALLWRRLLFTMSPTQRDIIARVFECGRESAHGVFRADYDSAIENIRTFPYYS